MRIDKKYKRKLLEFIHTHESSHVSMAEIGLEFNFFKGSLDDIDSLILIEDEFDKFVNTIRFLSDSGFVEPSNENLGISNFKGGKSVNPRATFSIFAYAHEQVEIIIEPWWKSVIRNILKTSGKVIWMGIGVAITVMVTFAINKILDVCS